MANLVQEAPTTRAPEAVGKSESVWEKVAAMEEFQQLLKKKAAFVIPATVFFVVYYFLLPVSVGYLPSLMNKKVLGPVNLAYLFALSQFFVSWAIAWRYVRAAKGFDESANRIISSVERDRGRK